MRIITGGAAGKSAAIAAVLLSLPAAASALSATDALGRRVALARPPQRIVSWAPNVTEILFALGLGDRVVGVTSYCNYPPQARKRAKIGTITDPSLEATLAVRPDLVIGSRLNPKPMFLALERAGVPSLAVDARSIGQTLHIIAAIGRITGANSAARRLCSRMRRRIDAVRRVTSALPANRRPLTLVVYDLHPLWTCGAGTFAHEAIEIAGGRNVAADGKGYVTYSVEAVLKKRPQVILVTPMHAGDAEAARRRVLREPAWHSLPAVKNGRVYSVNQDTIDRAGPRIVDAVEQIARLLHPELFRSGKAR